MSTISAVILAKNEEEMIGDCLDSVSFCDEVLVIDSGSHDDTESIAKKKKARVVTVISDDFSELRNAGLQQVKTQWLLYVDADERVSPQLAKEIQHIVGKKESDHSAYIIPRKNFYLGKHEWPKTEAFIRLFQKEHLVRWHGKLHESPEVTGTVGRVNGFLLHYTHRTLTGMVNKTITWSKVEAKLRFDSGHPKMTWWRFPRVMLQAFVESYVKQGGYKAGTVGLIESIYQAFSMFITYARLWELQQKTSDKK
jgi:glycosyltransferase involved in cell wall biosynthesis